MKRSVIRGEDAAGIAASIEHAIHNGVLAPGAALPPIRQLAASLRVSPVTVAAAYRTLSVRGLIESRGRRGTRVRAANPAGPVEVRQATIADGLYDLATGNPDPELLPPLVPALRQIDPAPWLYGEEAVLAPLASFAAAEFTADGVPAGQIAVANGALDAIDRLLRDHLRPADTVALEDPTVPAQLDLVRASGLRVVPISLDAEGPRPDQLEHALRRGARALIVTSRAQNPTGVAISRDRAAELARLFRTSDDVLVIENDPAGPVAGVPVAPTIAAHPRWAVVRSVSKFLGPDLRVALVTGDDLTMGRLRARHALGPRWVSHLLQHATLTLWSDPANGRRLARAADLYAQRRQALVDALAEHGISVSARSGFNVWIPVREETAVVQSLAARGWAVAAGERFRVQSGPGIRITTSVLDVESARRLADDCVEALRPSAAVSA